jgi:hypothetical protein
MVAVKINPAHVVSVPADYGNQKLRCCSYTVMFEVPGAADIFKNKSYMESAGEPLPDTGERSYFWGDVFDEDDGDI